MAVVVPAFMSLKVVRVIVLGSPSVAVGLASIASVKVAVTLTPGAILGAPLAGLVLLTLGAVVSAGVSAQSGSLESPSVVRGLTSVLSARTITPSPCSIVVVEALSPVGVGGGRVAGAGIA